MTTLRWTRLVALLTGAVTAPAAAAVLYTAPLAISSRSQFKCSAFGTSARGVGVTIEILDEGGATVSGPQQYTVGGGGAVSSAFGGRSNPGLICKFTVQDRRAVYLSASVLRSAADADGEDTVAVVYAQ